MTLPTMLTVITGALVLGALIGWVVAVTITGPNITYLRHPDESPEQLTEEQIMTMFENMEDHL